MMVVGTLISAISNAMALAETQAIAGTNPVAALASTISAGVQVLLQSATIPTTSGTTVGAGAYTGSGLVAVAAAPLLLPVYTSAETQAITGTNPQETFAQEFAVAVKNALLSTTLNISGTTGSGAFSGGASIVDNFSETPLKNAILSALQTAEVAATNGTNPRSTLAVALANAIYNYLVSLTITYQGTGSFGVFVGSGLMN
jgi:hypothetical protein